MDRFLMLAAAFGFGYVVHKIITRLDLIEPALSALIDEVQDQGEAIEHIVQDDMFIGDVDNG